MATLFATALLHPQRIPNSSNQASEGGFDLLLAAASCFAGEGGGGSTVRTSKYCHLNIHYYTMEPTSTVT